MRISFRAAERGFTLIELLVVMLILGITSSIVVLSVPRGPDPVEALTESYTDIVIGLSETAVASGRTYGLVLGDGGLEAYAWSGEEWSPRQLSAPELPPGYLLSLVPGGGFIFPPEPERYDKVFRPEDTYGTDRDEDDETPPVPEILFSPTGDRTPFVLSVIGPDEVVSIEAGATARPEVRYDVR